ncbi:MAG: redoxin family protein [Planctomycetia bacterium]
MSIRRKFVCFLAMALSWTTSWAADEAAPAAPADKTPAAKTPKVAAPTKDSTPADLLAYMEQSLTLESTDETPEGIRKAFLKTIETILSTSELVLNHADATDAQRDEALQFKISVMFQGAKADVAGHADGLTALAADLLKNRPKAEVAGLANFLAIKAKYENEAGLDVAALPLVEAFLKNFPGDDSAITLLEEIGLTAEMMGKPAEAKAAYTLMKTNFEGHPAADNVDGVMRRLELVGKPIALAGATVEGDRLDVAELKGKVVLVDFWATWCGPCMAEADFLRKTYAKYHDKGFEIVGVSMDEDADALSEFLKEADMPWKQVFFEEETMRGFANPIARHYGIAAIPSMFLVDASGNVVSTSIRGPDLEEAVAKLLGAAPAKSTAPAGN